ncbi:hypothetical protein SEA_BRAYBEAST_26 [Arthrobacter phage BrayBeast]
MKPVLNQGQEQALKSQLGAINPALGGDAAVAGANRLCAGEGLTSWDHGELIRGVQLHFGGPAHLELTAAQKQRVLAVVLDEFCHA